MMYLFIIFLSYVIGCLSTIVILIYLYIRYGLYPLGKIVEQKQYQTFHPLSVNDQSKNSTIDTVNYLLQFLFQEMKDTSRVRRYIMKKLIIEFDDLKRTKIGKLFLQDISIQSFSLGKECPIFSDIQLERQERDERRLIKEVVAKLHLDYKDGFAITLDIKLVFGYKCQLSIKVKRLQGRLRLQFRREPFSHWLIVFQDEPSIDFDIKAYLSSRESPQLAQIINQQIRRVLRQKQTWPSYKIRYQPFFPSTTQSLTTDMLLSNEQRFLPGRFDIIIKYSDRLSIPFELFKKIEQSLLAIFLTININEHQCEDYLRIHRDQWRTKEFDFIPKAYKISIKEVSYMNRREFLIEEFDPIPNEIDDRDAFKIALKDRNVFVLQIQGQEVQTLKQINRLIHGNDEQIHIRIGMPVLHSVQVPRLMESINTTGEIDPSTDSENSDSIKPKNTAVDKTTLIMVNDDFLEEIQAQRTPTQKAEAYIPFEHEVSFPIDPNEGFLNICLWCKPPLHCGVPNFDKKLVLLGYTTVSLPEIVFDTLMSFKRETQMTLNFRSVYTGDRIESEKKKLVELSTHKGYDDNMAHGYVTINVRYRPENEMDHNQEEKKERSNSVEPVILERDEDGLITIDGEHQGPILKTTDHLFEDRHFSGGTFCAYCNRKIWMKVGRQCRHCLITVHKKCEEKFNNENICLHEPIHSKSPIPEDEKSIPSTDDMDSPITTITPRFFTARRTLRKLRSPNIKETTNLTRTELSKNEESDNNSSPNRDKHLSLNPPIQTSSKFVNAASSAYSKFRGLKTKRSSAMDLKKRRASLDLTPYNDISEADLQDIIARCLSDENLDTKSLDDLFHEKAMDHTAAYAKANEFGSELFGDLTIEERKQKLENEICRLQQELDLQSQIRDEMIIECNSNLTDEHAKRKMQAKIANNDEKVQALRSLTVFYCSALKHCCSQTDVNRNSKAFDDNSYNQSNDSE